ncbi:ribonuclease H-like domain-containing protein [Tanacetum coccineum]
MPFTRLFGAQPDYSVLRVFGCLCYPHINTNHKLGPRATPSIFLGHAANHFGYRCLDLNTNKIIISRHVTFDETVFPFPSTKSTTTPSYDFLDDSTDFISTIIRTAPITPVSAPVHTPLVDVPTPPTPPTPPPPPTLTISRHWPVHQLDVKNAFLLGDLAETVYMHQPPGFRDPEHPDYGDDTTFLLLYVDDIVLTALSDRLLQQIIAFLHREFSMTNLGALNYFLGISVTRDSSGMFLSQRKYAMDILERAHMVGCNSSRTVVDTESKLGDGGTPVVDPTLYRSLAGDFGLCFSYFIYMHSLMLISDADWRVSDYENGRYFGVIGFLLWQQTYSNWSSKRSADAFSSSVECSISAYRGLRLKKTVKAVARFLDRVNRALGTGLIGKRVGNVLQQKTEAIRCFGTSIVVEETGSTVRDDGGDR